MTMSELYVLDNTKAIYDHIKKVASRFRAATTWWRLERQPLKCNFAILQYLDGGL